MRNFNAECPEGFVEVYNITCQICSKECITHEQVDTGEDWEWWCYCPECDMETFHPCFVPIEITTTQVE